MKLWYLAYAGIFAVIPMWLVWRAWRRYRRLNSSGSGDLPLAPWELALVSVALGVLLVLVGLATFQENLLSAGAIKTLTEVMPAPWQIGVINLLLCLSAVVVASRLRGTQEIVSIRRSIYGASIYLTFAWLFVISAAH